MDTARFNELCALFLADLLAKDGIKFEGARRRLGQMAKKHGLKVAELEEFIKKLLEFMLKLYVAAPESSAK